MGYFYLGPGTHFPGTSRWTFKPETWGIPGRMNPESDFPVRFSGLKPADWFDFPELTGSILDTFSLHTRVPETPFISFSCWAQVLGLWAGFRGWGLR